MMLLFAGRVARAESDSEAEPESCPPSQCENSQGALGEHRFATGLSEGFDKRCNEVGNPHYTCHGWVGGSCDQHGDCTRSLAAAEKALNEGDTKAFLALNEMGGFHVTIEKDGIVLSPKCDPTSMVGVLVDAKTLATIEREILGTALSL
jgi:hypothetical protein